MYHNLYSERIYYTFCNETVLLLRYLSYLNQSRNKVKPQSVGGVTGRANAD